jgi:predicted RND superfamily exporter protein
LINKDILNVGFVLLACQIYMIIHTRSLFLAVYSLLNMFMSVPITLYIYRVWLGVTYFASLHVSVIIIIVGIGCDDIFVFHDCWQNAMCIKALKNKPIERLTFVVRKAFMQMFVTSFTSAVAFLSCTNSPIMPIKSFGIFATIVVLICFTITMLMQPFGYYIYEKIFLGDYFED